MAVRARDEVTLTRIEVDEETQWHFWHDEEGAHVTEAERPGEGEPVTGKNVLVTGESILVRDGETVIASFGDDLIELGKGSESARIELCGGSTVISREDELVDIRSEVSPTGGDNNTVLCVGTSLSSISFYDRGLQSMPAIFINGALVLGRNTIVAEDRNARAVTAEQIFDALDNAAYVRRAITSFRSGFTDYSGVYPLCVMRSGGFVQLTGAVEPTSAFTPGSDGTVMFTVPEGFRPVEQFRGVMQGSGKSTWLLIVDKDGTAACARYGTTSQGQVPAGSWLVCTASWVTRDARP